MKLSKKWIAVCSALILCTSALSIRAADDAAAPKPAVVAHASASSIDEIKKLVADLGLPIPMDPTAMIEASFPFIGQGGLQTDKPLGVFFIAGENLQKQENMAFALPVVAGKATVAALGTAGGQAVADHPDMSNMGGINFKRTTNYLMWYPGALDILTSFKDDPFARDYNRPGRLALVSLDLATMRAAAPTQYKAFMDKSTHPTSIDPAKADSQKEGEEFAKNFFNSLDHVSLAIARDPQNIHIETWVRPFDFKGTRKFPRPTFPTSIVAQVNVAYPDAFGADWICRKVEATPESSFQNALVDAAHAPRAKALIVKLIKILGADAHSLAVDFKGGKPVVYMVNQYATDRDLGKEISAMVVEGNAFAKETNADDAVTTATYQNAEGKTISRLTVTKKGKTDGYLDYIQINHTAYFTFAGDDGKYLDAIIGLPTNGEISNLCTGSIDLTAALKASQESGKAPPMPPEQLKELNAAFNGQSITWVAKTIEQTKDVYIDLAIPFGVLKELPKMMMGAQSGPAPEPATETSTAPAMQN